MAAAVATPPGPKARMGRILASGAITWIMPATAVPWPKSGSHCRIFSISDSTSLVSVSLPLSTEAVLWSSCVEPFSTEAVDWPSLEEVVEPLPLGQVGMLCSQLSTEAVDWPLRTDAVDWPRSAQADQLGVLS